MAKVIRHLRDEQKEFHKVFSGLCESKSSWQVWADFVECAAIGISNSVDRTSPVRAEREARYTRIMNSYREAEREAFDQLFYIMANALELKPDQDFLGEMFMALELGNHWKGQFFTPYNVCQMMAAMQIGGAEDAIERRGWVGVMDPACGAGALLIAARNEFESKHFGYRQTLFVCQDIDHVAGLMCYIQLSLLGCAGYVVIADSICNPICGASPLLPVIKDDQDFWFMPMIYDEVWQGRIAWEQMTRAVELMAQKATGAVATLAAGEEESAPGVDTVTEDCPAEGQEQASELTADATGQLSFF